MSELLTLQEVQEKTGLELPTLRYHIYRSKRLAPQQKIGHYIYFKPDAVANFVEWLEQQLSLNQLADNLATEHQQKSAAQWKNWLIHQIYHTDPALPQPSRDQDFMGELQKRVVQELASYPREVLVE